MLTLAYYRKQFLSLVKGVFALGVEDINNTLFVNNRNVFTSLKNAMKRYELSYEGIRVDTKKISNRSVDVVELIAKQEIVAPSFILNERYQLNNLCNYSRSTLESILKNEFSLNINSLDPSSRIIKEGDRLYKPIRSLCIQIKKIN